jgi:endoglucanase
MISQDSPVPANTSSSNSSTAATPILPQKPVAEPEATSSGYTVKGSKIYDASGQAHLFTGLNRPSLEWSSKGDQLSLADYRLMKNWGSNVIRLPLNEKYWLQNTDNYQATVKQQVSWIQSLGMDVILDLHWSVGGSLDNKADQYNMADNQSVTFWTQVATTYKANTGVLFELYNEPRNIDWNIWQNGGMTSDDRGSYQAVGMQKLYDTVRATGAHNLVIIGGTNWAFDLSEVKSRAINGQNIVYASHVYDFYGKNTLADWEKSFGSVSKNHPVIFSEFGTYNCSTTLYKNLLEYAKTHDISWAGWAWFPGGCSFPALINDWNGTPSAAGEVVRQYLQ